MDEPFTLPNRNWKEAREYCQSLDPEEWIFDLISLQDKDEYNFMLHYNWSALYDEWKEQFSIWVGLNDREEESKWVWSDGSNYKGNGIESLPWMPGEPNDQNVIYNIFMWQLMPFFEE